MNVRQLHQLLEDMIHRDPASMNRRIRIGDQNEDGPYSHVDVGSIFEGTDRDVIICGDPDAEWDQEEVGIDHGLPVLWSSP